MGMTGESTDGENLEPEHAFHLVGHEIRVDILLALWRAPEHALAFSELRDRVDVRDSGRFTYHLSKLEGRFVRHEGDRYELLYAGHRVIDAIRSGVFHETTEVEPTGLGQPCLDCGATLAFDYAGHVGTVSCPDCGTTFLEYPFDPGGVVGRSVEEVAAAFDRRTRHVWALAHEAVCPVCSGTVAKRLVTSATKSEDHYASHHPVVASLDCQRCSFFSYVPVGGTLLAHPAVVSFLYERGVDVRKTPLWRLDFVVDADRVEVLSTDPRRVAVVVSAGDETMRVVVDDEANVLSVDG